MTAALETHPSRLQAENLVRSAVSVGILLVAVFGLTALFGRTGERIAVQMCVNVVAVVALAIYCGNTGIVSFGHGAFMALGAYLAGILTMPAGIQRTALPDLPEFLAGHELALWASLPLVAVAGLLFALLTGSAIARLVGASATIATLGLLIIVHSIAIGAREITRGSQTFFGVPRVTELSLALGAAVIAILLARLFRESSAGLFARAVRDDVQAATTLGIDARRTRLIAWCLSGAIATVGGALYGHMLGAFSPASFYLPLVFAHVVMMIVGGMASVGGAVLGVIAVTLLQDGVRQFEGGASVFGIALPEVFGLTTIVLGLAILFVIWARPAGLIGGNELGPGAGARVLSGIGAVREVAPDPPRAPENKLEAVGLSKSFAGVKAVTDVSFEAPTGRITGLIGPNGAGKSTLVNLLTGAYRADAGEARVNAVNLNRLPAHLITLHEVGRSFQNLRLFHGLTAYENVLVAALAAGHNRSAAASVALRELAAFDLSTVAHLHAGALPYGDRKRLELARALAQEPAILLLDEPAAGMNPAEAEDLADRLSDIAQKRGIGILLIDHDLRFVNQLSEWILVLNHGALIAEGTPDQVRQNPAVIESYIGRGRTAQKAALINDNETTNMGKTA